MRSAAVLAGLLAAPVLLAAPALSSSAPPRGAPATCAHQSGADFPRSARNLTAGPLTLVGARTAIGADAVRRLGGAQYPALVRAGHPGVGAGATADRGAGSLTPAHATPAAAGPGAGAGHRVVVAVATADRGAASLTYADATHAGEGHGEADGDPVVDFRSCSRAGAQSTYAGRPVTFWSGFVLVSDPRCVHLRVWADGARRPRTLRIAVGAACRG